MGELKRTLEVGVPIVSLGGKTGFSLYCYIIIRHNNMFSIAQKDFRVKNGRLRSVIEYMYQIWSVLH